MRGHVFAAALVQIIVGQPVTEDEMKGRLLTIFAAALWIAGPSLADDSDIVWPTYTTATRASDAALTCTQLHKEIGHVDADIVMLDTARDRVENILHTAFDNTRSIQTSGQEGYAHNFGGGSQTSQATGDVDYNRARAAIADSRRVALERRDVLTNLLSGCKDLPAAP